MKRLGLVIGIAGLLAVPSAQARYLHMTDAHWAATATLRAEGGDLISCQRFTARYIRCSGFVPSPFDRDDPVVGGTWIEDVRVHAEPGRHGRIWLWDAYHRHSIVR
jgi:hypothetical protein